MVGRRTAADPIVRGPAPLERIVSLDLGPGHRARARFADGATVDVDLADLIAGSPLLGPLRDVDLFAAGQLVDQGAGIEWPGGIDYSAGALRRLSKRVDASASAAAE
jgi:hypothetical protein